MTLLTTLYQLFSKLQNFGLTKIKNIADDNLNLNQNIEICFGKGRKHCGEKSRKCWLPAFSPFPTMFSKSSLYSVIKSPDCVVKA